MLATEIVPMPTTEDLRRKEILEKLPVTIRDEMAALLKRADATLDWKSTSYVQDARHYALLLRDYAQLRIDFAAMHENLSDVQSRCTELKMELREVVAEKNDLADRLAACSRLDS